MIHTIEDAIERLGRFGKDADNSPVGEEPQDCDRHPDDDLSPTQAARKWHAQYRAYVASRLGRHNAEPAD